MSSRRRVEELKLPAGIYRRGNDKSVKQIPEGNDRKKGKGKGQYRDTSLRSRMTSVVGE